MDCTTCSTTCPHTGYDSQPSPFQPFCNRQHGYCIRSPTASNRQCIRCGTLPRLQVPPCSILHSQALAALPILDVLQRSAVHPLKERARYLHSIISAKRLVYARQRAFYGDRDVSPGDNRTRGCCPDGAPLEAEVRALFRRGGIVPAAGQAAGPGRDTEALVVTDSAGRTVTVSQSIGNLWGSGIVGPGGFMLQGRGFGFTLEAPPGGPHANLYGPGRRPLHTLCSYMVWPCTPALCCDGVPVPLRRGSLTNPLFFVQDRPRGPPTANHQLPTANPHQPPITDPQPPSTATNRQRPIATNHG